ncbi:hypothetical protein Q1695_002942 [Nippostrongylus brasiliensis]|nr:hypothetical protein Q1695_002942 [Nippostrongylus brasiliensis]
MFSAWMRAQTATAESLAPLSDKPSPAPPVAVTTKAHGPIGLNQTSINSSTRNDKTNSPSSKCWKNPAVQRSKRLQADMISVGERMEAMENNLFFAGRGVWKQKMRKLAAINGVSMAPKRRILDINIPCPGSLILLEGFPLMKTAP